MDQICVESRFIAEDLYALLHSLERAGRRHHANYHHKGLQLAARARSLVQDHATPDTRHAALLGRLSEVSKVVEELPPPAAPVNDWAAFRKRAAFAYESLAASLRAYKVRVPSLRPKNYARSLFHVLSGLFALGCIELLPGRGAIVLMAGGFLVFAWTLEISRRYSDHMSRLAMWLFKRVIHPHEHTRVNSATWYATALFLLAITAPLASCALAVTVLAFADPAAALVGRKFGRIKVRANRSLEGTAAFVVAGALASFGVLAAFHPELSLASAAMLSIAAATAGALAELYSGSVDDNFTIPSAVAAATWPVLAMLA